MIHFTADKEAWQDTCPEEIVDSIDDEVWKKYCGYPAGTHWDIIDGKFTELDNEEFMDGSRTAETHIEELKQYLADTDYVVIKIYEATVNGEDTAALREEYAEVLTSRASARAEINDLQERYGL